MSYEFSQSDRQLILTEGIISGLQSLVRQNKMSKQIASQYLSGWTGSWTLEQTKEADKEIKHLLGSLSRLKQLSQLIARDPNISFDDPRIGRLNSELKTFDGWTLSLLETDLSIIAFIDPKKAQTKQSELQSSFSALMNKRITELDPYLKDPSLFKNYVS